MQKKETAGRIVGRIIFQLQSLKLTARLGYRDSFHDRQNKHVVNNDDKVCHTKLKFV